MELLMLIVAVLLEMGWGYRVKVFSMIYKAYTKYIYDSRYDIKFLLMFKSHFGAI